MMVMSMEQSRPQPQPALVSTAVIIADEQQPQLIRPRSWSRNNSPSRREASESNIMTVSLLEQDKLEALAKDTMARGDQARKENQYEDALRFYGEALDAFQRTSNVSTSSSPPSSNSNNKSNANGVVVSMMATCLTHIGDLHASSGRFGQASLCFQQSGTLLQSIRGGGGDEKMRMTPTTTSLSSTLENINTEESRCLDVMIVETLQKRAEVNLRLQRLQQHQDKNTSSNYNNADIKSKSKSTTHHLEDAIECHQHVVDFLMDLSKTHFDVWQRQQENCNGSTKTSSTASSSTSSSSSSQQLLQPISKEQHTQLLLTSLEALAKLYRRHPASVDQMEMTLLENALDLVRRNQDEFAFVAVELARILVLISDVYVEMGQVDAAFDGLDEAIDIFLLHLQLQEEETNGITTSSNSGGRSVVENEDTQRALEAMDMVGTAYEENECYEQAMASFEKVLLVRNRLLGNKHLLVAKSLVQVARIMELQDNIEGSLDLYRAAQAIYANHLRSDSIDVEKEDVQTLLELFPTAMDQGRYEEVVAYLSKCVEVAEKNTKTTTTPTSEEQNAADNANGGDDDGNNIVVDKAYVYFNLGKAYAGLEDYVSATICLMEAAKYEGEASEEQIFSLLQRVEFLQRNNNSRITRSSKSDGGGDDFSSSDEDDSSTTDVTTENSSNAITLKVLSSSPLSISDTTNQESDGNNNKVAIVTPTSMGSSQPRSPARSKATITTKSDDDDDEDNVDSDDDEGTAFYDSESVSAFDPVPGSDVSSYLFESDVLDFDDAPAMALIDTIPSESDELDGSHIEIPPDSSSNTLDKDKLSSRSSGTTTGGNVSTSVAAATTKDESTTSRERDLSRNGEQSTVFPSLQTRNSTDTQSSRGFRIPKSSSFSKKDNNNNTKAVSRSSLAKTLTGRFRRQRKGGFQSMVDGGSPESGEMFASEEDDAKSPASSLPSEEEYHAAVEGPIQFVTIPDTSWDSGVSLITMRFDDPSNTSAKDTSHDSTPQEWWWGITTEGFARWFPTSYVSNLVEAAEGFLSAKSIHSKKVKCSSLEYMSDEESTESKGSVDIADHPSHVGIADSYTARPREWRGQRRLPPGPRNDSALSVYSGRQPQQQSKETDKEISRYTELVKRQREKVGIGHPDLATQLFTLAVLHSRNQATAPAIEYAAEALRIQKATGELDDASRSLHFLADLYLHQKQYNTALTFYSEALRLERNHFGNLSDEAATTLNCIGTVHSLQNDFSRAMESHQEALRILKECHGEDPKQPLVSETLCQIGAVYYRERNSFSKKKSRTEEDYTTFIEAGMLETIGRAHEDRGSYKLAMSFFEEKLQFLESRCRNGADEGDLEEISVTLNSLGMLSSRAGLLVEAIDYYEKALKIQLKLGCDKVQLATARVLTGAVYYHLGDFQQAQKLHQEALGVLIEELGAEHQTVAAALFQLGVVQAALFELDTSMTVLKQALNIQQRLLGIDHPATLRTRREIATLFSVYKSGSDSALEQLDDVLAAQRRIHGDRHPNIAETLHSIGRVYSRRGDFASALTILEECYFMRSEFLGWDHPQQAATLHEISKIHLTRGRVKKALQVCEVVLGIRKESLSEVNVDVALTLATKADCLVALGKMDVASQTYAEALAIAEQAVGPLHPNVADILVQIGGSLQTRQCNFENGRLSIEKALTIYRNAKLQDDYPGMQEAREKLDRVKRDEMLCV